MSVFMVLLLIGVTLPVVSILFSLLFGSFESLVGLLKFDLGNIELNHDIQHDVSDGVGHIGFISAVIPMSPIVWCVQLAVTGCVGELLSVAGNMNMVAVWVIALISGYTLMLVIHNCVLMPLKRASNFADTTDDMIGKQAEITETILENGVGAVRIISKSGSAIYAAKSAEGVRIEQGETVIVSEITDGRATVNKLGGKEI